MPPTQSPEKTQGKQKIPGRIRNGKKSNPAFLSREKINLRTISGEGFDTATFARNLLEG